MAILNYAPATNPSFTLLYKDEDMLVLDKPSGLLTVPGKALEHKDSLQTRIQRVLPTATIVHRLDMATSGVIVMALNKAAHRHISKQFETRQTSKIYYARVHGHIVENDGLIDLPLICDWPNRPKQMVCHTRGKPSQTRWQVEQRENNSTRVKLTPITGRSHQLRVHMLSLGHPILGDRLYAHEKALEMAERLQLHAHWLQLCHPVTGQELAFSSPVPF